MANGARLGWLYYYRNSQLSPGAQRFGPVGGGPGVPRSGDRSAPDLGGLKAPLQASVGPKPATMVPRT